MSTPTTHPALKPEGYIIGHHHNRPIPVTIIRRTKTTIVVQYLTTSYQRTFNLPKTAGGSYYERGPSSKWFIDRLELNTAKIEAQIAKDDAAQNRTNHALGIVNQITHAMELQFGGCPKQYHGTDSDLQKLEAALATLTA